MLKLDLHYSLEMQYIVLIETFRCLWSINVFVCSILLKYHLCLTQIFCVCLSSILEIYLLKIIEQENRKKPVRFEMTEMTCQGHFFTL